jgi:outer membrane protein TolC
MRNLTILLSILILSSNIKAMSFQQAVLSVENHLQLRSLDSRSIAVAHKAKQLSSWGDPKLSLALKNYPVENFNPNLTPMSAVDIGISQKIALTSRYGKSEDAFRQQSQVIKFNRLDKKRIFLKQLWELLIKKRKLKQDLKILKENYNWINKMIKVSKKLYSHGKSSQQAILELKIRREQLRSDQISLRENIKIVNQKMSYITQHGEDIDLKSVPWKILDQESNKKNDYRERIFTHKLKAKELLLDVSKLNIIPDVTLKFNYSKRKFEDGLGDFATVGITIPLPFSDVKYQNHKRAVAEKYSAEFELRDYKNRKRRDQKVIELDILKVRHELKILKGKILSYARDSRSIAAKSYSVGQSSYYELLRAELKFQKILLKKSMLSAQLAMKQVLLKYITGGSLYE